MCILELAGSRASSWHNDGPQNSLYTGSITIWKSITMFTRSWPPNVSSNRLDSCVQVRTITASKYISEFARSQPPGVTPNLHDYSLQSCTITVFNFALSKHAHESPNSSNHELRVLLNVLSIMGTKCISKSARLEAQIESPNSFVHSLGMYLWVHSTVNFRRPLNCYPAPPAASPNIPCVDG